MNGSFPRTHRMIKHPWHGKGEGTVDFDQRQGAREKVLSWISQHSDNVGMVALPQPRCILSESNSQSVLGSCYVPGPYVPIHPQQIVGHNFRLSERAIPMSAPSQEHWPGWIPAQSESTLGNTAKNKQPDIKGSNFESKETKICKGASNWGQIGSSVSTSHLSQERAMYFRGPPPPVNQEPSHLLQNPIVIHDNLKGEPNELQKQNKVTAEECVKIQGSETEKDSYVITLDEATPTSKLCSLADPVPSGHGEKLDTESKEIDVRTNTVSDSFNSAMIQPSASTSVSGQVTDADKVNSGRNKRNGDKWENEFIQFIKSQQTKSTCQRPVDKITKPRFKAPKPVEASLGSIPGITKPLSQTSTTSSRSQTSKPKRASRGQHRAKRKSQRENQDQELASTDQNAGVRRSQPKISKSHISIAGESPDVIGAEPQIQMLKGACLVSNFPVQKLKLQGKVPREEPVRNETITEHEATKVPSLRTKYNRANVGGSPKPVAKDNTLAISPSTVTVVSTATTKASPATKKATLREVVITSSCDALFETINVRNSEGRVIKAFLGPSEGSSQISTSIQTINGDSSFQMSSYSQTPTLTQVRERHRTRGKSQVVEVLDLSLPKHSTKSNVLQENSNTHDLKMPSPEVPRFIHSDPKYVPPAVEEMKAINEQLKKIDLLQRCDNSDVSDHDDINLRRDNCFAGGTIVSHVRHKVIGTSELSNGPLKNPTNKQSDSSLPQIRKPLKRKQVNDLQNAYEANVDPENSEPKKVKHGKICQTNVNSRRPHVSSSLKPSENQNLKPSIQESPQTQSSPEIMDKEELYNQLTSKHFLKERTQNEEVLTTVVQKGQQVQKPLLTADKQTQLTSKENFTGSSSKQLSMQTKCNEALQSEQACTPAADREFDKHRELGNLLQSISNGNEAQKNKLPSIPNVKEVLSNTPAVLAVESEWKSDLEMLSCIATAQIQQNTNDLAVPSLVQLCASLIPGDRFSGSRRGYHISLPGNQTTSFTCPKNYLLCNKDSYLKRGEFKERIASSRKQSSSPDVNCRVSYNDGIPTMSTSKSATTSSQTEHNKSNFVGNISRSCGTFMCSLKNESCGKVKEVEEIIISTIENTSDDSLLENGTDLTPPNANIEEKYSKENPEEKCSKENPSKTKPKIDKKHQVSQRKRLYNQYEQKTTRSKWSSNCSASSSKTKALKVFKKKLITGRKNEVKKSKKKVVGVQVRKHSKLNERDPTLINMYGMLKKRVGVHKRKHSKLNEKHASLTNMCDVSKEGVHERKHTKSNERHPSHINMYDVVKRRSDKLRESLEYQKKRSQRHGRSAVYNAVKEELSKLFDSGALPIGSLADRVKLRQRRSNSAHREETITTEKVGKTDLRTKNRKNLNCNLSNLRKRCQDFSVKLSKIDTNDITYSCHGENLKDSRQRYCMQFFNTRDNTIVCSDLPVSINNNSVDQDKQTQERQPLNKMFTIGENKYKERVDTFTMLEKYIKESVKVPKENHTPVNNNSPCSVPKKCNVFSLDFRGNVADVHKKSVAKPVAYDVASNKNLIGEDERSKELECSENVTSHDEPCQNQNPACDMPGKEEHAYNLLISDVRTLSDDQSRGNMDYSILPSQFWTDNPTSDREQHDTEERSTGNGSIVTEEQCDSGLPSKELETYEENRQEAPVNTNEEGFDSSQDFYDEEDHEKEIQPMKKQSAFTNKSQRRKYSQMLIVMRKENVKSSNKLKSSTYTNLHTPLRRKLGLSTVHKVLKLRKKKATCWKIVWPPTQSKVIFKSKLKKQHRLVTSSNPCRRNGNDKRNEDGSTNDIHWESGSNSRDLGMLCSCTRCVSPTRNKKTLLIKLKDCNRRSKLKDSSSILRTGGDISRIGVNTQML